MTHFTAVLMAGGQGQRFWPLSTKAHPKQFLDLAQSGRTLLQNAADRLLPLTGSWDHLFVGTAQPYRELVLEQLPDLPAENLIVEPIGRDSAPAIALAAITVQARFPDAVVGFFPTDHLIVDNERFETTLRAAVTLADTGRGIVTVGITPTRPATGYGYLEIGPTAGNGAHRVARFVEKPDLAKAQCFLAGGRHLWNAGIFVGSVATILNEIQTHAPDLHDRLQGAFKAGTIDMDFPMLERISFDYAVMERCEEVYVVPGDFIWDDLGDWPALGRLLATDAQENAVVGYHIGLDTTNSIIYADQATDTVMTLGVKDLVIVKRGDTVMVAHRDRMQDLKKLLGENGIG